MRAAPRIPNGRLHARQQSLLKQQTDTIVPGSLQVTVDGKSVSGLDDASTSFRVQANGISYSFARQQRARPRVVR
jgi:hypothetical protein